MCEYNVIIVLNIVILCCFCVILTLIGIGKAELMSMQYCGYMIIGRLWERCPMRPSYFYLPLS